MSKKSLIIVESPAKTKTLKNFLGSEYQIEASMGHVVDLPKSDLGVDISHGFKPKYVPIPERRTVLSRIKESARKADHVYLATDPDREGEAIAWHLVHTLRLKDAKRITFNEITHSAVTEALQHPRDVDKNLFNAQQARRVLDRLVGYKISPLLWSMVRKNLSAGRVQSVALRLICDREREIQAFVPTEYWSITARLTKQSEDRPFNAKLVERDGKKIEISTKEDAERVLADLDGATYTVADVKKKQQKRNPAPPFITSTLQQEASRKLGFSNKKTMMIAQQLYEGVDLGAEGHVGLITYMRTDSTRVANEAIAQARECILKEYGEKYLPASPRQYKSRKSAQDAHEAIRPTDACRRPEMLEQFLTKDQLRLYRLIWQRFLASQMESAVLDVTTVNIAARNYTFRATGSVVTFDGFTVLYTEGKDNGHANGNGDDEQVLPALAPEEVLRLMELVPKQHFTEPPPRYTEATLVKALEEKGIGRPSTYANIISTIQERRYVYLDDRKFYPTKLGFEVTNLLVKYFPDIMDVEFTAGIEAKLDEVEEGNLDWVELMSEFWGPFSDELQVAKLDASMFRALKEPPPEVGEKCPNCGASLVIRDSKYGQFIGCSAYPFCKTVVYRALGDPCPVPDCGGTIVEEKRGSSKLKCSNAPRCPYVSRVKVESENDDDEDDDDIDLDQLCPKCARPLVKRVSSRGPFLGCSGFPRCRYTASISSEEGEEKAAPEEIMPCPSEGCGGMIVRKQSRFGDFYACNRYPACKYSLPGKPLDRKCPQCGSMLVEKKYRGRPQGIACISETCDYREAAAVEETPSEAVAGE